MEKKKRVPILEQLGNPSKEIYLDVGSYNPVLIDKPFKVWQHGQLGGEASEEVVVPEPYQRWLQQAYSAGVQSVQHPLQRAITDILDLADLSFKKWSDDN